MPDGRVVLRLGPRDLRRPQVRVSPPPPPTGCDRLHQPPPPLRVCQRRVARVAFRRVVAFTLACGPVRTLTMVEGKRDPIHARPPTA